MKRVFLLSTLITLASFVNVISQTTHDTIVESNESVYSSKEIKGVVLDIDKQTPLPYANIFVLHKNKGAISNEMGHFSIDITGLDNDDTIRFQYIGFSTRKLTLAELDTISTVYLKEEIFNLSETIIFGNALNARSIVKKVLQYKDSNYKKTITKNLTFIRDRNTNIIENIQLNLKKSSITQLDKEMIEFVENAIPRESISYNDFMGNIYHSGNPDDSIKHKTDPIKIVSLKEKDIAELDQIETIFEDVFTNIGKEEYWKVKSGIFSQKIDDDNETKNDTLNENNEPENDTIKESGRKLVHINRAIQYRFRYSLMNDKDSWEFLYKTGKYNYTLSGGTRVNGEDVYIIDFTPKSSGKFIGRMYISMSTYALVRADYEFDKDKIGRDFHMFGIGYTENQFSGSIYFEKKGDNYVLKYYSKRTGFSASIERDFSLIKKRERFLFDKKLNEIKVGVDFSMNQEESVEYLVLDRTEITQKQFSDFAQKERMEVIYVDQFDDSLWKGFAIIEPIRQMREYKKQEVNYSK